MLTPEQLFESNCKYHIETLKREAEEKLAEAEGWQSALNEFRRLFPKKDFNSTPAK